MIFVKRLFQVGESLLNWIYISVAHFIRVSGRSERGWVGVNSLFFVRGVAMEGPRGVGGFWVRTVSDSLCSRSGTSTIDASWFTCACCEGMRYLEHVVVKFLLDVSWVLSGILDSCYSR